MKHRLILLTSPLLLCAVMLSSGCNSKASYDSPEDVFSAATKAMEAKDMKKFMGCMTSETQDVFAGGLAFVGVMMKSMAAAFSGLGGEENDNSEGKEEMEKIGEVLSKHGLTDEVFKEMENMEGGTPEEALKELTKRIDDKVAFVSDMMEALESMDDTGSSGPADTFKGELTEVKTDGDSATGVIVVKNEGGERKEDIQFKKVDGSWLIHMEPDFDLPGGPAPGL